MNTQYSEALVAGLASDAAFFCGSDYVKKAPRGLEMMRKAGVEVVIDDYDKAASYQYFLADKDIRVQSLFDKGARSWKIDVPGRSFVYLVHNVGAYIEPKRFGENDFVLCPSEAFLTSSVLGGKYICDAAGRHILGRTLRGTECALMGLPHISDEMVALTGADKKQLRAFLAARLNLDLDPDLPLLFFLVDRKSEKDEMENVCRLLSQNFNVVIKNLGKADPVRDKTALDVTGPNIFYFDPPPEEAAELFYKIRIAADFTLADFYSGGLLTNIMLGLRTLSYHSTTVSWDTPPTRYNWTYTIRDYSTLAIKLLYYMAPLPLVAPELILRRLEDAAYWERYDKGLETLQKYTFGSYCMGQAALEKSAMYIRRLLRTGSFMPAELPADWRVIDGPIPRPPCPVVL